MKRTIFGITVGILLLTTSISVAIAQSQLLSQTTSFDDTVPEWEVGDSWTYTVDSLTINYDDQGQKLFIDGRIDDFTWTVTDTSDSTYYQIDFTGKLTANYDIILTSMLGSIHLTGTFKNTLTRLKGTILFTKESLQIYEVTAEIKGLSAATIAPLKFPLPLPFKLTIHAGLSVDFPLFDFPLSSFKFWSLPDLGVTMQAYASGIFGIIGFPINFIMQYSWIPLAFYCQDKQDVTVAAGTFSAYKISTIIGEFFEYYYAPEVGNIIKIDSTLQNGAVHAELKSTNYS
ncbi:MAG: hypothetical protein IMZ53_06275 [Thermoplasmata archaeon]|nr:hypothetical protein [Thermoplasmata archaeon]MBE3140172.1 hypothetical protein [Thermoplasmata archaeon]